MSRKTSLRRWLFFLFKFYWSIFDIKCCDNFCCTTVIHLYIYTQSFFFQSLKITWYKSVLKAKRQHCKRPFNSKVVRSFKVEFQGESNEAEPGKIFTCSLGNCHSFICNYMMQPFSVPSTMSKSWNGSCTQISYAFIEERN